LARDGAIVVERLNVILSAAAERAERDAPGEGADALIWEELEQNAGEETRPSVTYLTFMAVAMMIASLGVLLDSTDRSTAGNHPPERNRAPSRRPSILLARFHRELCCHRNEIGDVGDAAGHATGAPGRRPDPYPIPS
jgi:hypothetical protein